MITEITYYAADWSMGDLSEAECDSFRKWAKERIEAEYPGAMVDVENDDSMNSRAFSDCDDYTEIACAMTFLASLWDECDIWG